MTPAPAWWRLEMAAPPELEESLLWKLQSLGISRVALRHRPEAPEDRQLLAWLPEMDWSEQQRLALQQALAREVVDDLHQVVLRQAMLLSQLANRDQALAVRGAVHQHAQRVVGVFGKTHGGL